jgi:hypothetical protein
MLVTLPVAQLVRFSEIFCAVSVLLYAFVSLVWYVLLMGDTPDADTVTVLPWGFENIRYWSHVATWILPLFPVILNNETIRKHRRFFLLVCASFGIWGWILFLSGARGSIIAILAGFLVCYFVAPEPLRFQFRRRFTYLIVGALFLTFLLEYLVPSLLSDVKIPSFPRVSMSGRWPLWLEAYEMGKVNFPFGMGPQSWLTHEVLTGDYLASKRYGHPHNMYLLWAAEYGWLFVGGLFCGVMWVLRYVFVKLNRLALCDPRRALLMLALLHSFTAACIHAVVSAVFIGPASLLVGWFVIVGILRMTFPTRQEIHPKTVESRTWWSKALYACAVALALSFNWYWDALLGYRRAADEDRSCYTSIDAFVGNGPRFWLHGDFPRPSSLACDESRIPEDVRRALD